MESSEAASRRMSCIASHLAANPQNSWSSSLATMVCSSSSGIQSSSRKDGRILYARPNSHVPAYLKDIKDCEEVRSSSSGIQSSSRKDGRLLYARPSSHVPTYLKDIKDREGSNAGSATQAICRKDSRLMFARQGCHTQAYFLREHAETQVIPSLEKEVISSQRLQSRLDDFDIFSKTSSDLKFCMDKKHHANEEPFFARPLFARPLFDGRNEGRAEELDFKELQTTHAKSKLDWCPRMDIAEAKDAYIVTIELPGVNADGIRVEVNSDRLLVSGSRSMDLWIDNKKQSEEALYHRRELSQGPFRAQWPIPKNSNIDSISAEFMDGFLRIIVPKNAL